MMPILADKEIATMDQTVSSPVASPSSTMHPQRPVPKWYLAYFFLAAFDVLTISGSLYLNHTIMGIFSASVAVSEEWAGRLGDLSTLRKLGGATNAPGNDVFDSRDVPGESARLQAALTRFLVHLEIITGEINHHLPAEKAEPIVREFGQVRGAMDEMVQEATQIFTFFTTHQPGKAGERMATMDRKYAQLNASIAKAETQLRQCQASHLKEQRDIAQSLQFYEFVIALCILLMVGGASVYGHKIYRRMQQAAAEKEQLIDELVLAKEEAEAGAKTKGEFLATISHEIRTPMNGVLGMTDILLESHLDQNQRECAETVMHSAESLLTIINDILDFSKIESGKLDIEVMDFDLRVVVDEVLDLLGAKAQDKGLELVGLVYASIPTAVRGDPGRFRQILLNLVGNAIKFTEQGEVVVQVVPEAETEGVVQLRIDVVDTGLGLNPEGQGRLFEPFTQADGSTTRHFGGTGLGLSICKQLVELMGGTIGVESQPGHGSRFWFTVRLETQVPPTAPEGETRRSLDGLRVCIVDDNDTNRLLLYHYLSVWGMSCLSAESGPAALVLLKDAVAHTQPCDLLLLDMQMPEMDGLELARQVKADRELSATRMVMLTSLGCRGDAVAAREAGIVGYLTKPIHQGQLRECLSMVMHSSAGEVTPLVTKHTIVEAAQRRKDRLLVADDNMVNQKVAVRMLERLGYRVDVVANGLEAVKAVSRIPYHAVLMDCQMPEMDGYEATAEIRHRRSTLVAPDSSLGKDEQAGTSDKRHLPIIAMTASAMKGEREKCLEAGMDDFVSKPVKLEELGAVLDRWVPKRETSLVV